MNAEALNGEREVNENSDLDRGKRKGLDQLAKRIETDWLLCPDGGRVEHAELCEVITGPVLTWPSIVPILTTLTST